MVTLFSLKIHFDSGVTNSDHSTFKEAKPSVNNTPTKAVSHRETMSTYDIVVGQLLSDNPRAKSTSTLDTY